MSRGWIGVDLDGTLAHYEGWKSEEHIGEPVPRMVERVRELIAKNHDVRIFTARVWDDNGKRDVSRVRRVITEWCIMHIGHSLEITNVKDYGMIVLYDDRAIQIIPNTGRRADGQE